jgi:hypothetical protein
MISYLAAQKGAVKNMPKGFIPYEYKTVGDLARVICHYTWSPIIFKDNYRASANFQFADLAAFDFDNDQGQGYTINQAKNEFGDLKIVIGTTRSHQLEKNGKSPQDRFRVIARFESRITCPLDYVATMQYYSGLFEACDQATNDTGRQFFPCREIVHCGDGELLPVIKAPPMDPELINRALAYRNYKSQSSLIPRHINDFIEHGKVFGGSRNSSVYISSLYLIQKGFSQEEIFKMIIESPFDRRDFCDKEIIAAIKSASKKR